MSISVGTAMGGGRLASSFGVFRLMAEAGAIVKLVLLLLAAFSVICWAIIAFKWRELSRAEQDSEAFLEIYRSRSFGAAYQAATELDRSPLCAVFLEGFEEIRRHAPRAESIQLAQLGEHGAREVAKQLEWAAARQLRSLERGLSFLATTGSSAPFIGLFGTVVGIIQAFQGIAAAGSASLAVVAPGIAEALVATGVGLVAAIPATIFYNYFVNRVEALGQAVELFRTQLAEDVAQQARGGARAPVRATGTVA